MNPTNFETYLLQRQYSPGSIESYKRCLKVFFAWTKSQSLDSVEVEYSDLLEYVRYCGEREYKRDYISKLLGAVRHWYTFLKYTNQINSNPAAGLFLRGRCKRLPHDLLTLEQMEEIYSSYARKGPAGKRNKIMLGLMIYQALTSFELDLLEPHHLRLREGKIEVPATRRSSSRTLKIESHQILELQEYITRTRQLIIEISEKQSTRLFVSTGESDNLRGCLEKLSHDLRKKYPFFINVQQIRQSRLAIWVKLYDVRQVQHMAGHRYVSSTERYQSIDLEDLQHELKKHHPHS